jgi:HSP20 family protein
MTLMTRWSPVGDLAALEIDRLNRMFEAALGGEAVARNAWAPAVDIYETPEQDVVVKMDLPDVKREDIKVTVENHVLAIEGERKVSTDVTPEQVHQRERSYGAFRRTFTLPSTVDASRVDATYQDGVLTVKLARREDTRPKQIPING